MTGSALGALCAIVTSLAAAAPRACAEGAAGGLSTYGSVSASFAAWEDRGSALIPRGSMAAWSGAARAEARAEAGSEGDGSRCAIEGCASIDASSGAASFALRELWAEWRPLEVLSLRAGRQRLGFGSGLAWNPSNDLDARRDPADPSAPRAGLDAACLRLGTGEASGLAASLSLVAALPETGEGLEATRLAAQLYSYVGGVELMAVGSCSRPGEAAGRWLAGGWATAGLGPFVLGLEGAIRKLPDRPAPGAGGLPVPAEGVFAALSATATLRLGDFTGAVEAFWDQASYSREEYRSALASGALLAWAPALLPIGSTGAFHGLLRAAWSSGDLSAAATALVDLGTGACLARAELSAASGGDAAARLSVSAPAALLGDSALEEDELGLTGRGLAAQASISVYF